MSAAIRELFEVETHWWSNTNITRDHRYDPSQALTALPEDIRSRMLHNKCRINKTIWEREHIEWLKENASSLYVIEESVIFFYEEDLMTMFMLAFG